MILHTKILDAARDEVAKSRGFSTWFDLLIAVRQRDHLNEKVIELAMEKQAEFYRSISNEGWLHEKEDIWYKPHDDSYKTELELYNIWREGK